MMDHLHLAQDLPGATEKKAHTRVHKPEGTGHKHLQHSP